MRRNPESVLEDDWVVVSMCLDSEKILSFAIIWFVLKSQHPTITTISLIPCAGWVENICLAYHVILISTDCSWNILSTCWPAGFGGFAVWFSFCLFLSLLEC